MSSVLAVVVVDAAVGAVVGGAVVGATVGGRGSGVGVEGTAVGAGVEAGAQAAASTNNSVVLKSSAVRLIVLIVFSSAKMEYGKAFLDQNICVYLSASILDYLFIALR